MRNVSEIIPGRNYPILCCMYCGGDLRKGMGGYICKECGELFTLEEAGLQDVEITSQEEPKKERKCPDCGNPDIYPTHNMADERVFICEKCDIEIPWDYYFKA